MNDTQNNVGRINQLTQANIDPYYLNTWTSGDPPKTNWTFATVPVKSKVVSDIEKVAELFSEGIIDKETAISIISKHLDKHGPKEPSK